MNHTRIALAKMDKREKQENTRNLSISSIAHQAGVDKSHVSLIMSGKRLPSLVVAKKIAVAMGVSMDELCDRLI